MFSKNFLTMHFKKINVLINAHLSLQNKHTCSTVTHSLFEPLQYLTMLCFYCLTYNTEAK